MYVMAFNGSPRQDGTTATLLRRALEGAASRGAKTEFVQLSQLDMKGCQACYSCKKRGGESLGKCALRDDMTPLYAKMEEADAVFLGSPIYFGTISSAMKMLIERLFAYFNYSAQSSSFPRKIPVGLIVTMGADDQQMESMYRQHVQATQALLTRLLGPAEIVVSTDTLHVQDYSTIVADRLQPLVGRKSEHQRAVFPLDCRKAFEMGARFAARKGRP